MIYRDIHAARFIARPNRFIARVEVDGREETVHVKNTGRCKELLLPGCTVYLEGSDNPQRKTRFDLVAVEKVRPGRPPLLINMDSQAPNRVFGEWMKAGKGVELGLPQPALLRPETTWGNSRFDFYWEESGAGRKGFIEVKGCTLEEDGLALFPDAPTQRGVKHLEELTEEDVIGEEPVLVLEFLDKDGAGVLRSVRYLKLKGSGQELAVEVDGVCLFAADGAAVEELTGLLKDYRP